MLDGPDSPRATDPKIRIFSIPRLCACVNISVLTRHLRGVSMEISTQLVRIHVNYPLHHPKNAMFN